MNLIVIVVNSIFAAGMFINAVLFIPQGMRLIKARSSESISLATFGGFCLIQAAGTAYGYIHQDKILMFGTAASLVTCGFVTVVAIYYRVKS